MKRLLLVPLLVALLALPGALPAAANSSSGAGMYSESFGPPRPGTRAHGHRQGSQNTSAPKPPARGLQRPDRHPQPTRQSDRHPLRRAHLGIVRRQPGHGRGRKKKG